MPQANELIVQALEEAGIEYVFGIPGGGTGQIFGLLHGKEDIIKTIQEIFTDLFWQASDCQVEYFHLILEDFQMSSAAVLSSW